MRNVIRTCFFFHELLFYKKYESNDELNITVWIKKNSYFISNNDNYFTNFNFMKYKYISLGI